MHDKLARLTGASQVAHIRDNPVDHCCHETAGMNRAEEKIEHMAKKTKVVT